MRFVKDILPLFAVFIGLSSCSITSQINTFPIEILKPGIFEIPENYTVAVMNRDLFRSDTCTFYYRTGYLKFRDDTLPKAIDTTNKYQSIYEMVKDTSVTYRNLSDTCVNELINYLDEEGYFPEVINLGDRSNFRLTISDSIKTSGELFEKTNSDVCIFLDYLSLNTLYNQNFELPFGTRANLLWTVVFKNDSLAYYYNHTDTLYFDHEQINEYSKIKEKTLGILLNNSCKFLGRSFGTKVIPNWIQVDRMYYHSHHPEMLKAEKLALHQDWLKAAEFWNRETKNKNRKIAAKACFNMAVACEMEGKLEPAIDWLIKSYSSLEKNNEEHRTNCQRYVNILVTREKDIERLAKQVRN